MFSSATKYRINTCESNIRMIRLIEFHKTFNLHNTNYQEVFVCYI